MSDVRSRIAFINNPSNGNNSADKKNRSSANTDVPASPMPRRSTILDLIQPRNSDHDINKDSLDLSASTIAVDGGCPQSKVDDNGKPTNSDANASLPKTNEAQTIQELKGLTFIVRSNSSNNDKNNNILVPRRDMRLSLIHSMR